VIEVAVVRAARKMSEGLCSSWQCCLFQGRDELKQMRLKKCAVVGCLAAILSI
jgi:hypothetical protein